MTAGETINGATLPVPVYQDSSDGEVYACDANVSTKLKFIGFATSNSTDGNTITVQLTGRVDGFTGLTQGTNYFVQDTVGTIGTIFGTYPILAGRATSTTEIKIITEGEEGLNIEYIVSDTLRASADTQQATTSDSYVKKKDITIKHGGTLRIKFDLKSTNTDGAYGRIYVNGVAIGTERITFSTTYATYSEDIGGFNTDDEVQLYIRRNSADTCYIRNFRLYWDKAPVQDYIVNID